MLKHGLCYWSAVSSGDAPILVWEEAGPRPATDTPPSQVADWLGEGWQVRGTCCWRSEGSRLPTSGHPLGLLPLLLPHIGQGSLGEVPLWCGHTWRAVAPHASSIAVRSGGQKADPWLGRRVKAPGGLTAGQTPVAPDLKMKSCYNMFTKDYHSPDYYS